MRRAKRKQSGVATSIPFSVSRDSSGGKRSRLLSSKSTARRRKAGGVNAVFRRAVRWIENFVTQSVGRRK